MEEEEITTAMQSSVAMLLCVSSECETLENVPQSEDGDLLHLTPAPWIPSLHSSITDIVPQCMQI